MRPQCLEVIFKSPVERPPFQPSQAITVCVFVRVCVSDWVQALLGFSGVWTAGRVVLIGQNDAEMDRKPPWSSWSSFSLSLTFTLSLRFNHSLIFPPSPPLSALLFISIALLSQPRLSRGPGVAPLIFHIPLFLLFGLFPKALWVSGGKLLASDYSHTVISPCFAPLSVSFASLDFPFHFYLSLAVFPPSHCFFSSVSLFRSLTTLGLFFYLVSPLFYPFKSYQAVLQCADPCQLVLWSV